MEGCLKMKLNNFLYISLLAASPAYSFDLSGHFKLYGIRQDITGKTANRSSFQGMGKIQAITDLSANTKAEIAYELSTLTDKPLPHTTPENNYRIKDLKYYLHDEKYSKEYKTRISQNLNRFNLSHRFDSLDLNIGRMPIAFGAAKSINPTDVLTPFSFSTIDKEERTGVDTINAKIPFNNLSLMEVGVVLGENAKDENNAYFLRPKLNINEYDISFTLMRFTEINLIGFDLQHPINDAGFWLETSYLDQTNSRVSDFFRLTTGIDYKFQNSLYFATEYHYNGARNNSSTFKPLNFIYLKSNNYFILTSNYEFTPLVVGSLQSYNNLDDKSSFTLFKIDYNAKENYYLTLGTYRSVGDDHNTEFGKLGHTYFASMRYYF